MLRENKIYILVILAFISLGMFLFVLYINSTLVLEKQEIPATLSIGDRIGFDVNATALTFGMITPGSGSQRNLIIENNYGFPIKAEFSAKGDIKRFLVFDEVFCFEIGEKKTIGINVITSDEKYRNYSGKMIVVIKRDILSSAKS